MNHRPVCSKCEIELRPIKNGVQVVEHSVNGPYKIWDADEWECPECRARIVMGFGANPLAAHYEDHFKRLLSRIPAELLRHGFESTSQRIDYYTEAKHE